MAYVLIARLLATALALAIQRARQDPVQGAGTKAMMADEQTTDKVGSNLNRFAGSSHVHVQSVDVRVCLGLVVRKVWVQRVRQRVRLRQLSRSRSTLSLQYKGT